MTNPFSWYIRHTRIVTDQCAPYITVGIYSQHTYTHITYERDEGQDPESKSREKEAQGKVEGARENLSGLSRLTDRKR